MTVGHNRRAARTDENHREVSDYFRALGCSVHSTHRVGDGFPDIVVGTVGLNLLVEIKDGRKPPSRRRLTGDERRFVESWRGRVEIVESMDDVTDLIDRYRSLGIRLP